MSRLTAFLLLVVSVPATASPPPVATAAPASQESPRPLGSFTTYVAQRFAFEVPTEWRAAFEPGAPSGRFTGPREPAGGGVLVQVSLAFDLHDAASGRPTTLGSLAADVERQSNAVGGSAVQARAFETQDGALGLRLSYTSPPTSSPAQRHAPAPPEPPDPSASRSQRNVVYALPLDGASLAVLRCAYPADMPGDPGYGALFYRIGQGLRPVVPPPAEARTVRSSAAGISVTCPAGWETGWYTIGCGQEGINAAMNPGTEKHTFVALAPAPEPGNPRVRTGPVGATVWITHALVPSNDPLEVYRRARPAEIEPFQAAAGRGERLRAGDGLIYLFPRGRGAVGIEARGVTPDTEPIFDALAASLAFFPPTALPPDARALRTFRGHNFEFDHPGDWHVPRPLEDEAAGRPVTAGEIHVYGPRDRLGAAASRSLRFSVAAKRDLEAPTLDELIAELVATSSAPGAAGRTSFATEDFQVRSGLRAVKVVATHAGRGGRSRGLWMGHYAIELPGGGCFLFTGWSGLESAREFEAMCDAIAASFRVVGSAVAEPVPAGAHPEPPPHAAMER